MRILILGEGAREDATRLHFERFKHEVFVAPGNGGMPQDQCQKIDPTNIEEVMRCAQRLKTDLVLPGSEDILAEGVVDALVSANIAVFGPTREATLLESSKKFTKELCSAVNIPTARYKTVTRYKEAEDLIATWNGNVVVKADGLCQGKGVTVARDTEHAKYSVAKLLTGVSERPVLLEEFLEGPECSVLALCDGHEDTPILFPAARDYKQIYPGGPNTGGMGAYSPLPDVDDALLAWVRDRIIAPALQYMRKRGTPFVGILYAGLKLTPQGPKLIEFNVRFGDPEAQVILPRMACDLAQYYARACAGDLKSMSGFSIDPDPAVCIVLACRGYPEYLDSGFAILDRCPDGLSQTEVYYAGVTRGEEGNLVAAKGRVLSVVGRGETIALAKENAEKRLAHIHFHGMQWRKDIASGVL